MSTDIRGHQASHEGSTSNQIKMLKSEEFESHLPVCFISGLESKLLSLYHPDITALVDWA